MSDKDELFQTAYQGATEPVRLKAVSQQIRPKSRAKLV